MSDGNSLEKARSLRGNADSGAGHVRGLYISFLVLAVYIGVIIGSTGDEQLLRVEPVTLPILGVGLPIVAFYALVPWLFVLLHFNILLQHYLLSRKLHLFAAALAEIPEAEVREEQRAQLFSFPFSHLLVPGQEGGLMRLFYGVMVWSTLIILPLGVLLWAQVRFLPYHDVAATWSQRSALLLDVALLWIFWPRTLSPGVGLTDQLERIAGSWAASRQVALPLSLVSVTVLVVSFFAALVPGEAIERTGLAIRPLVRTLFDSPNAPFHRSLQLAEAVLVQGGAPPEGIAALRRRATERHREVLPRIAGLVLADRDLRFADLRGAILVKADLRGAALDGARLSKANLAEANLRPYEAAPGRRCASGLAVGQAEIDGLAALPDPPSFWLAAGVTQPEGAGRSKLCRTSLKAVTLGHAVLQGTVLSFARIEDTAFPSAFMNGANFSKSVLKDVRAPSAQMESARFTLAEADGLALDDAQLRLAKFRKAILKTLSLTGTVLTESAFDGAILEDVDAESLVGHRISFKDASLTGVSLVGAKLSDAMFDGAKLTDVDLSKAALSQASFRNAEISGLVLDEADLKGAAMDDLDLSGARLLRASVHGTSLRSARLVGVQASGVQIQGADLVNADLRGADLAGAQIKGSDLSGADLRGSRLTEVDLFGVFLVAAKLQGALIEGLRFRAVDLSGAWLDPHFMSRRLLDTTKAGESMSLNLRDARLEPMTEGQRAELSALIAPYHTAMSDPWTLAPNDGTAGSTDWSFLAEIAFCGDRACLDLETFAEGYSDHLGAYLCKDTASQKILLRNFDASRSDGDAAQAYKYSIATRLIEARCDPGNELSQRLQLWAAGAQRLGN